DSTPAEGTQVAKNSPVNLVVASGNVKVPGVVGELEAQARADLINAGFEVSVIRQTTDDKPAGTVLAQNPKADTLLQQGKIVTITVAVAPTPTPTPTPTSTPTDSSSPSPGSTASGSPSPSP